MKKVKAVPLDEKDKAILTCLINDPRISVADIARELNVQRDTVLYRIKRLEQRGVVTKYHTIVDPQALGLSMFVLLLIKLTPVSGEEVQSFVQKLVAHKNVTHVSRLIGIYDYAAQVAAEDVFVLDSVIVDIKGMQPGIIANIDISNVIDGLKTDDFSGLL
ncbi:Lrp/AsnC family transcriptional regulator [bacterium]|nr:Lrp/AsnC family transcriptional regulator [bacterium]